MAGKKGQETGKPVMSSRHADEWKMRYQNEIESVHVDDLHRSSTRMTVAKING